jgi:hypothetical protein
MKSENKIWVFGDSYSTEFKDGEWGERYIKYLGREPKIFIQYLSEELNLEYVNHSVGGADNYEIFERFCKYSPLINEDDIVIFGWSSIPRFRLVTIDDRWVPIVPHHNNFLGDFNDISEQTVNEILANRMSKKYAEEVNSWITLINIQKFKSIHWTPFQHYDGVDFKPIRILKPETITQTTNGDMVDGHFSDVGQKQLSKIILNLIRNHGTLL